MCVSGTSRWPAVVNGSVVEKDDILSGRGVGCSIDLGVDSRGIWSSFVNDVADVANQCVHPCSGHRRNAQAVSTEKCIVSSSLRFELTAADFAA